jgi:hypothetical protein
VSTRAKRPGNPQGAWSLDRGERNNESKIGKNYLLRSNYPQSEDYAIVAFGGMMLPLNAALSMILFDLGAAFEKRCSEERRTCAGCLWPVTREDLPARPCAGYGREPPMLRLE